MSSSEPLLDVIKRRLVSGSAWSFSGKIVAVLAGLAVNALLARLMTPEELGVYFLTFSAVTVGSGFSQMGMNQAAMRLVAESMGAGEPGKALRAIVLAFWYAFFGSVAIMLLVVMGFGNWVAVHMFDSVEMGGVVGVAAIWVTILTFQGLIADTFRGFHDIRLSMLFGGLLTSLLTAVILAVAWMMEGHATLHRVVVMSAAAGGASTLAAAAFLYGRTRTIFQDRSVRARTMLDIAWPLWINGLLIFILAQADMWILGFFQSKSDVAVYGAASRMAVMVMSFTSLAYSFIPPMIADLYSNGKKEMLESILKAGAFGTGILSFPVLFVFLFFPDFVLGAVYGKSYVEGDLILQILAVGLFVNVITGIRGHALMMTGHGRQELHISLAMAAINVVACVIGAKYWGKDAVALAAMSSMVGQCLLELFAVRHYMGIWCYASPGALFKVIRFSSSVKGMGATVEE